MAGQKTVYEQLEVAGDQVVSVVKGLLHQGNIRRIVVRYKDGRTLMDIPVTAGAVGVLVLPGLAAVGAIAAVVGGLSLGIERSKPVEDEGAGEPPGKR